MTSHVSELLNLAKMTSAYCPSQDFLIFTFLVLYTEEPNWVALIRHAGNVRSFVITKVSAGPPILCLDPLDKRGDSGQMQKRVKDQAHPEKPTVSIMFVSFCPSRAISTMAYTTHGGSVPSER
jgi:hypothetical protein